jgi:hypothetical protein
MKPQPLMALAAVVAAVTLPACCICGKECCRKGPLDATEIGDMAGPGITGPLAKTFPGANKPPSPAPKKSEYGKRGGRAGAAPAEAPIEVQ